MADKKRSHFNSFFFEAEKILVLMCPKTSDSLSKNERTSKIRKRARYDAKPVFTIIDFSIEDCETFHNFLNDNSTQSITRTMKGEREKEWARWRGKVLYKEFKGSEKKNFAIKLAVRKCFRCWNEVVYSWNFPSTSLNIFACWCRCCCCWNVFCSLFDFRLHLGKEHYECSCKTEFHSSN